MTTTGCSGQCGGKERQAPEPVDFDEQAPPARRLNRAERRAVKSNRKGRSAVSRREALRGKRR